MIPLKQSLRADHGSWKVVQLGLDQTARAARHVQTLMLLRAYPQWFRDFVGCSPDYPGWSGDVAFLDQFYWDRLKAAAKAFRAL